MPSAISLIKKIVIKLYSYFIQNPISRAAAYIRKQQTLKQAREIVKSGNEIWVEVGAGNKKGTNGWVTIDLTEKCDIYWDLRYGIPFPDASVSKIYSSHFFEHLTFRETQIFLDECKRVLKPGGTFSICVPNARIYIEAYAKGETLDTGQYFGCVTAYNNTTRIDYINYMAYMDGQHKYMFDQENLLCILTAKGFKNVRPRTFDPSLDLQVRDYESIYAEAER